MNNQDVQFWRSSLKRTAPLKPLKKKHKIRIQSELGLILLYHVKPVKLPLDKKRKEGFLQGSGMEKKTSYTYYREALENNSWLEMKTKC